jgi:H+/Cl- antiporter ClcA
MRVLDWRWELLILIGLGLVFAFIASWALRSVEYKARRDARLTLRWQ